MRKVRVELNHKTSKSFNDSFEGGYSAHKDVLKAGYYMVVATRDGQFLGMGHSTTALKRAIGSKYGSIQGIQFNLVPLKNFVGIV